MFYKRFDAGYKKYSNFWSYFLNQLLYKNYSLDSRSLSLFRVCIAVILLVNFLFTRLPFFNLFHSENGVLPLRNVVNSGDFFSKTTSLNFIYSGDGFQIFLFGLAILCAVLLLFGYRTRWALFGSWLLLVSLHAKNSLVINSGDNLLVLLLFWSLLLPLNSHFSLDRACAKNVKSFNVFSIGTVTLIGQILMVYVFAGALKTSEIWKDGSAVYYALMLDNFRTIWGDILLQYPKVMEYSSYITYYFFEISVAWLFVFFGWLWRVRVLLVFLMIGFHFSLGLFLTLGLFSWVCAAGWLVLLPSEFWDRLNKFLPGRHKKLTVYYDEDCFFCRQGVYLIRTFLILPHVLFMKSGDSPEAIKEMKKRNSWLILDEKHNWYDRWQVWVLLISCSPLIFYLAPVFKKIPGLGNKIYSLVSNNRILLGKLLFFGSKQPSADSVSSPSYFHKILFKILTVFFGLCFLYALAWNIRTTNFKEYVKYFPSTWNGPGQFFHLHQHWAMFAPKPANKGGWIILSATKKIRNSNSSQFKNEQKNKEESKPLKIDLWQKGKLVTMEKPYRYSGTFPGFRHRKLIENLIFRSKSAVHLQKYLQYWCRKWNNQYPENRVKNIEFIYMEVVTPSLGGQSAPPKFRSMKKVRCRF